MKKGYRTYRAAAFLSRAFPVPFGYWLGMRIADLFFRFDRAGRESVMGNLRRIQSHRGIESPPGAVRGLARKTYQNFGKYLIDFFRFSLDSGAEIASRCSMERIDHLRGALAGGRGALVVTAHVGNWELGGMVLALAGIPVTAVYRPSGDPRLDELFTRQREQRGLRLLPLGRAVRGMLQALQEGGAVAILADRGFTPHAHRVPFFGKEACLPRGAAELSVRTGAPIVPAFMLREPDDRFRLRCYPPILPGEHADAEAIERRIVAALEDVIGANPVQWFVFEDFWKGVCP